MLLDFLRSHPIIEADSTQDNTQVSEQLSEYAKKLLDIMEYDIPYTRQALMEKLELKSNEDFRRNYLHPAIELNLVRITIPKKQTVEISDISKCNFSISDSDTGRQHHRPVFFMLKYEGLHCGDVFDVKINGKWIPTRIEFGRDWFLVGIKTDNLVGLIVRI